jgi:hypothetical protein
MKWRSNSYHMLISSLPALPPRFDVERLPITFERLQGRLRMLEPEDAEEIERMLAVIRCQPVRRAQQRRCGAALHA